MIALSDFKYSLRLMDTGDAELDTAQNTALQGYLDAAASYVQSAVGAPESFCEAPKNISIYRVAVLALAGAYFSNPVAAAEKTSAGVDLVLNNIVGQLRYRYGGDEYGPTGESTSADSTTTAGDDD
jgi:uncharacterized phage protein (predicted DNA packaging)